MDLRWRSLYHYLQELRNLNRNPLIWCSWSAGKRIFFLKYALYSFSSSSSSISPSESSAASSTSSPSSSGSGVYEGNKMYILSEWRYILTATCVFLTDLKGDAMSTSLESSVIWSNAPSKKRSAACSTSLYCFRAARAWAGVAPYIISRFKILDSSDQRIYVPFRQAAEPHDP